MPPCHASPSLHRCWHCYWIFHGYLGPSGWFPGSSLGRCLSWLFMTFPFLTCIVIQCYILVQDHPNLPRLWVDRLWDEFLCERKREVRLWSLRQVATALSGWPLFGLLAQVSLRKVRPGVLVGWCVASNQIHEVYQSSIDHPKKI
jgi:hypothetical protein